MINRLEILGEDSWRRDESKRKGEINLINLIYHITCTYNTCPLQFGNISRCILSLSAVPTSPFEMPKACASPRGLAIAGGK